MFATIILDSYRLDEMHEMAKAIEDSCSALDTWGWASVGIYCFWNIETKEILYIGLASDLYNRFKQHNGLISCKVEGTKQKEISEYFQENEKLGYSIFVQSPLSQIGNFRNTDTPLNPGSEASKDIKHVLNKLEGRLIKAVETKKGKIPKWNKINGKIAKATEYETKIIDFLTNSIDNPLIARSTLREIYKDPTTAGIESFLHGVKMWAMVNERIKKIGVNLEEAILLQIDKSIIISDFQEDYAQLIDSYYSIAPTRCLIKSKEEIKEYLKKRVEI